MGTSTHPAAPLPRAAELLDVERMARRQGSGVDAAAVLGQWRLHTVWPRRGEQPSAIASAMLRGLGARLTIAAQDGLLAIANTVSLGVLTLEFSGRAELTGQRPLLRFSFVELRLRLGPQTLWTRPLPQPPRQRLPFFALIARGPEGWLAARGRGGGLALWQLES